MAGRDFDEAGTRAAFGAMDLNKDGAVSFYEYSTVQLKLIAPEEYGPTVKMLTRVLNTPDAIAHKLAQRRRSFRDVSTADDTSTTFGAQFFEIESAVRSVRKLPFDLDIFSLLMFTKPLCTQ